MFNVNYSNINGAVAVAAHRGVKSGEADRKIKHGGDDDEAVNTTPPVHTGCNVGEVDGGNSFTPLLVLTPSTLGRITTVSYEC